MCEKIFSPDLVRGVAAAVDAACGVLGHVLFVLGRAAHQLLAHVAEVEPRTLLLQILFSIILVQYGQVKVLQLPLYDCNIFPPAP